MAAKKTIENKPSKLKKQVGTEFVEMGYFDVIKLCLDSVPAGGFTRDDIKKRNRIEEKLIGEHATLEHDEFYTIKKICNDMKWANRSVEIETFLDYLDDVK